MVITAEVDPVFVIDRESPGTHFRGKRSLELSHFTGIGIDGEQKKRGFMLPKRKVNRIPLPRLSWADIGSPTSRLFHRNAEIPEGIRNLVLEAEGDKNEDRDEKSDKARHLPSLPLGERDGVRGAHGR